MKDIKYEDELKRLKIRVNGIVLKENKVLVIKSKNNSSYYLPGGHIELGEDSKQAVSREMLEELGTEVVIKEKIAIAENFYLDKCGKEVHEISFYYVVDPIDFEKIPMVAYERVENDKGEMKLHKFDWLDINAIKDVDFKPEFLREKLLEKNYEFEHVIIKNDKK